MSSSGPAPGWPPARSTAWSAVTSRTWRGTPTPSAPVRAPTRSAVASVELVRALFLTAVDGAAGAREALEQTLIIRLRAHVRQNLRDPELSPETVAAALAVSPRQLYRACAAVDLRLEQWVIETRLERAKAELAHPSAQHRTIAAVARRWGFKDPTHFTRRFRAAYGVLPSDWRRSG